MIPQDSYPILFFDDDCLVCNGFARFVLAQDKGRDSFRFAALQSERGQAVKIKAGDQLGDQESMILQIGQRWYTRSTALAHILRQLGGGWRILGWILSGIPIPLRDGVYNWIARNRYRLGKKRMCTLLSPEERRYFL